MSLSQTEVRKLLAGQATHDQNAHSDIYRLGKRSGVRHFYDHFVKYQGRCTEILLFNEKSEVGSFKKTLIDCLLICLAAANNLNNFELTLEGFKSLTHLKVIGKNDDEIKEVHNQIYAVDGAFQRFSIQLSLAVGSMANAYDKMEHYEEIDELGVLQSSVQSIFLACVDLADNYEIDIYSEVVLKRDQIKQKNIK